MTTSGGLEPSSLAISGATDSYRWLSQIRIQGLMKVPEDTVEVPPDGLIRLTPRSKRAINEQRAAG
jgi:hypothetical protein